MRSFFAIFNKKTNTSWPQPLVDYNNRSFSPSISHLIENQTFIILDCETTGFEKTDDIISIGAVKLNKNRIPLSQVLDIRFPVRTGKKNADVHGELANSFTVDNPALVFQLLDFIQDGILVGHNVGFDISKINQLLSSSFQGLKLKNKQLDTFMLMKRIDPVRMERNVAGHDSFQLDALCKEFDIEIENRHTALGDAYLTAQLLAFQLNKLKKRGIVKIGDLLA